jgi:N-methylhydantoinase B
LKKGDLIVVQMPGGGGYGPPSERDPNRISRDLREGRVSK